MALFLTVNGASELVDRPVTSALLSVTSHWFEIMEAGSDVGAIFFDYRKAFDSVPHRLLVDKPISLHINPCLLRWIINYLSG